MSDLEGISYRPEAGQYAWTLDGGHTRMRELAATYRAQ